MRSDNHEIDYDAIVRRAHAMRTEAIADMARAVSSLFRRRKPGGGPHSA